MLQFFSQANAIAWWLTFKHWLMMTLSNIWPIRCADPALNIFCFKILFWSFSNTDVTDNQIIFTFLHVLLVYSASAKSDWLYILVEGSLADILNHISCIRVTYIEHGLNHFGVILRFINLTVTKLSGITKINRVSLFLHCRPQLQESPLLRTQSDVVPLKYLLHLGICV